MSRKEFIESNGATCLNWTWSWSFVNHEERVVIFGAWDKETSGDRTRILSKDWMTSRSGHRHAPYTQALEHLRLVGEEDYRLKTFSITHGTDVNGQAKIKSFTPELSERYLESVGDSWFAVDVDPLREGETAFYPAFVEGKAQSRQSTTYERSANARRYCIDHFGYRCAVCDFDFEEVYGTLGKEFIHVHHVIPVSTKAKASGIHGIDPRKDLVPVCANCHAIIHRGGQSRALAEIKEAIRTRRGTIELGS